MSGAGGGTCEEEISLQNRNQSVYIALDETHRLENPSAKERPHPIESQSGNQTSEEDIVRYKDRYKR